MMQPAQYRSTIDVRFVYSESCQIQRSTPFGGVLLHRLTGLKTYLFSGDHVVVELLYLKPVAFFRESLASSTVSHHLSFFFPT